MRRGLLLLAFTVAGFLPPGYLLDALGQVGSPRDQLKQYVVELQGNPNDNALREKIIKLAAELKPPPEIPEEARRHFVEGATIASAAKDTRQQVLAIESFKEALKIAPWWADAYYNLGAAQELAHQFDDSERSLKLYLQTNPVEKEAREVQDRIYALGAKRRLAEAEAARIEAERRATEEKYGWLVGEWEYVITTPGLPGFRYQGVMQIRREGNFITSYDVKDGKEERFKGIIQQSGDIVWQFVESADKHCPTMITPIRLTVSPDRRQLSFRAPIIENHNRPGACSFSTRYYYHYALTR